VRTARDVSAANWLPSIVSDLEESEQLVMRLIIVRLLCLLMALSGFACAAHRPVADWRPAPEQGKASALRAEQTLRVHTQDGAEVDLVFDRFEDDALIGRTVTEGSAVRMPMANIAWVERKAIDGGKTVAIVSVWLLALMVFGLSQGSLFTVP
jgi:hypothetical protein